jgi:hypothetical protein
LKVVPALTSGDAEPLLRLVAEAESLGGGLDPFTSELLGEIGRLVPADWIAYNELDRVRRRNLFIVGWPCEDDDDDGEPSDEDWELQLEHPTCLRHQQGFSKLSKSRTSSPSGSCTGRGSTSARYRPEGIEYEMTVAIPSPLWFESERSDHSSAGAATGS